MNKHLENEGKSAGSKRLSILSKTNNSFSLDFSGEKKDKNGFDKTHKTADKLN